jgi:hypothetical protein
MQEPMRFLESSVPPSATGHDVVDVLRGRTAVPVLPAVAREDLLAQGSPLSRAPVARLAVPAVAPGVDERAAASG